MAFNHLQRHRLKKADGKIGCEKYMWDWASDTRLRANVKLCTPLPGGDVKRESTEFVRLPEPSRIWSRAQHKIQPAVTSAHFAIWSEASDQLIKGELVLDISGGIDPWSVVLIRCC
jgi:hypothetical protein